MRVMSRKVEIIVAFAVLFSSLIFALQYSSAQPRTPQAFPQCDDSRTDFAKESNQSRGSSGVSCGAPGLNCETGSLRGSFTVDQLGQSNYSIPIVGPPGRAGIQPDLSLSYNSVYGNRHIGMGFQLIGASSITRCPANELQDSYHGGVHLDLDDRFCLDGKRLVAVEGDYGEDGTKYHTNPDSLTLVVSHGQSVPIMNDPAAADQRGPLSFRVYLKNGLILEYGGKGGKPVPGVGQVKAIGRNVVREWALSRVIDRSGNFMAYSYEEDPEGDYWLKEIQYTGLCKLQNGPGDLPGACENIEEPFAKVVFHYDTSRPDVTNHYVGGTLVRQYVRLIKIETFTTKFDSLQGGLAGLRSTRYELEYESGPTTTMRSRLSAVRRCKNNICLPRTVFEWSDPIGVPGIESSASTRWGMDISARYQANQRRFQDQWGPGIVGLAGSTAGIVGAATNPTPLGLVSLPLSIFDALQSISLLFNSNNEQYKSLLGDFNGDGRVDVARFDLGPTDPTNVWLSNGSSFDTPTVWATGFGSPDRMKVADMNADGKSDIIVFAGSGPLVSLSTGSSFQNAINWLPQAPTPDFPRNGEDVLMGDVNGDGFPDAIYFERQRSLGIPVDVSIPILFLSNGSQFEDGIQLSMALPRTHHIRLGDVNGDRKVDLIVYEDDNSNLPFLRGIEIWLSEGTDFRISQYIDEPHDKRSILQLGDFNGDRLADIAFFKPEYNFVGDLVKTDVAFWLATGEIHAPNGAFVNEPFIRAQEFDIRLSGSIYDTFGPSDPEFVDRIADFNGDGLSDIINFNQADPNRPGTVRLSRGAAGFSVGYQYGSGFGDNSEDAVADLDGDGRADVLQFARFDPNESLFGSLTNTQPFPDKLISVTDGFGKKTLIEYAPISSDAVYEKETPFSPKVEPGTSHFRGPFYVVDRIGMDSGVPDIFNFSEFKYEGAKVNASRGLLGFSGITQSDSYGSIGSLNSVSKKQEFYQDFPLTGLPRSEVLNHSAPGMNDVVVALTSSTWEVVNQTGTDVQGVVLKVHDSIDFVPDLSTRNSSTRSSQRSEFEYDGNLNLTREEHSLGCGNTWSYDYGYNDNTANWNLGRIASVIAHSQNPEGETSGHEIAIDYGPYALRRLPQSFDLSWLDGTNIRTIFHDSSYDVYGNQVTLQDSASDISPRTLQVSYELHGRFMKSATNELDHVTNVIVRPEFGTIAQVRDPNGNTSTGTYDFFGRPTSRSLRGGTQVAMNYCPNISAQEWPTDAHHAISIEAVGQPRFRVYYDKLDRKVREEIEPVQPDTLTVQDFHYDRMGRMVEITSPYFLSSGVSASEIRVFDELHRIVALKSPDGNSMSVGYSAPANIKSSPVYSNPYACGMEKTATLPGGRTQFARYDELGRLMQLEDEDSTGGNQLSLFTQRYTPHSNVAVMASGLEHITAFQYDRLGNLKSIADPNTGTSVYTTDSLGRVASYTDGNGITSAFQYDKLDRLVSRTDGFETYTNRYDEGLIGEFSGTTGPNGNRENYHYDRFGRLRRYESVFGTGEVYETSFTYDPRGRMRSITYPTGSRYQIGYSASGYPYRLIDSATSEVRYALYGTTPWGKPFSVGYNDETLFTLTGFDAATGQTDFIDTGSFGGATYEEYIEYSYDNLSRLSEVDFTLEGWSTGVGYDKLHRVTSFGFCDELTCSSSMDVQYDKDGNILYKTDIGSYVYPLPSSSQAGLPTQIGGRTYQYDSAGQVIDDSVRSFSWNGLSRPRTVTNSSDQWTFVYNSDMRKTSTSDSSGNFTHFSFDQFKYESATNESWSYIYFGDMLVGAERIDSGGNRTWFNYHLDQFGSVVGVTDSSSTQVSGHQYGPFGEFQNNSLLPTGEMGFLAKEQSPDFGLVQTDWRLYDPKIGRFLSPDAFINIDNTQSINRYSYAQNSPTNYVDNDGLQTARSGQDTPQSLTKTASSLDDHWRRLSTHLYLEGVFQGAPSSEAEAFARRYGRPLPAGYHFATVKLDNDNQYGSRTAFSILYTDDKSLKNAIKNIAPDLLLQIDKRYLNNNVSVTNAGHGHFIKAIEQAERDRMIEYVITTAEVAALIIPFTSAPTAVVLALEWGLVAIDGLKAGAAIARDNESLAAANMMSLPMTIASPLAEGALSKKGQLVFSIAGEILQRTAEDASTGNNYTKIYADYVFDMKSKESLMNGVQGLGGYFILQSDKLNIAPPSRAVRDRPRF